MDSKLSSIKLNNEWKTTILPQALQDQDKMEKVWVEMKMQEKYSLVNVELDELSPDSEDGVKIVCISDTHGKHQDMDIPDGDILIHAGDFTMLGLVSEVILFNDWLASLPHKVRIVT